MRKKRNSKGKTKYNLNSTLNLMLVQNNMAAELTQTEQKHICFLYNKCVTGRCFKQKKNAMQLVCHMYFGLTSIFH